MALTSQEFVRRSNEKHNYKYTYENCNFEGLSKFAIITCPSHGRVSVSAGNHMRGNGCGMCGNESRIKSKTLTQNDFLSRSKAVHKDRYDYSKAVYKKRFEKLTIVCKVHGEFYQTPSEHWEGSGCKKCGTLSATKLSTKTNDAFIEEAKKVHGDSYDYSLVEYKFSLSKVVIICKVHGQFCQTPDNHLHCHGCPKCVHQISSQEERLSAKFPFFKQTEKQVIAPYHLDLYSEAHNLAIEINGRYWHSENKGKPKNYHLDKTKLCEEKGITLLHFWDDELDYKFDIVNSMINSRLGKNERIYARECNFVEMSKEKLQEFLNSNHLQGYSPSAKQYALGHNGDIVSIMTFGKPRFNKQYEWEMIRFSTKLGFSVVGGASKLFKKFIDEVCPCDVLTYADRRYSTGEVYKKLGFVLDHFSTPSYFYSKGIVNIPRYQAQKHKLSKLLGDKFDPTLSESDNMKNNGYSKVHDCGNAVFIWKPLTNP